jgi:hypothetical protein
MMAAVTGNLSGMPLAGPGLGAQAPAYLHALHGQMASHRTEVFAVAFLDGQDGLIGCETMFYGTAETVLVNVLEVARAALRYGAAAIAVAHNHPLGCPKPSAVDVRFTRRLMLVMTIAGMPLKDHFIVTPGAVHSMLTQGPWPLPLEEFASLMGYGESPEPCACELGQCAGLHARATGAAT